MDKTFDGGPLTSAIRSAATALLAGADAAGATELRHLLAHTQPALFRPGRQPAWCDAIGRYMPEMLALTWPAPVAPIAAPLTDVWDKLRWGYHYAERADAPGLAELVAFSEVLGPDGPLAGTDVRVGFTFMAPGVLYPLHAHPAVELYVVLSGRAVWTNGSGAAWQDPGAVIVHATDEPHAMETKTEPLLALYSWRGALSEPARYL